MAYWSSYPFIQYDDCSVAVEYRSSKATGFELETWAVETPSKLNETINSEEGTMRLAKFMTKFYATHRCWQNCDEKNRPLYAPSRKPSKVVPHVPGELPRRARYPFRGIYTSDTTVKAPTNGEWPILTCHIPS